MKHYIILTTSLVVFILLTNYSRWFRLLIISPLGGRHVLYFHYSTIHRDFSADEDMSLKGPKSYIEIADYFSQYKQCQPTSTDTVLYRTFQKEPFEFWNWLNYFTHPRYHLPYINPELVKNPPNWLFPTTCPEKFLGRPLLKSPTNSLLK